MILKKNQSLYMIILYTSIYYFKIFKLLSRDFKIFIWRVSMSPFFPSDMKLQENSLPDDDVPPSPSKGVVSTDIGPAQNLHHALWTLGPQCSEEEVFDSIWRLVMYLRYWKGGSDRTCITSCPAKSISPQLVPVPCSQRPKRSQQYSPDPWYPLWFISGTLMYPDVLGFFWFYRNRMGVPGPHGSPLCKSIP